MLPKWPYLLQVALALFTPRITELLLRGEGEGTLTREVAAPSGLTREVAPPSGLTREVAASSGLTREVAAPSGLTREVAALQVALLER